MKIRHDDSRGQSMVEFALVIPVFLLLIFGIIDLGRVVWANDTAANAAREAARFAIVRGERHATCPVGPPGPDTLMVPPSASCPHPSPSKQAIYDVARDWAFGSGSSITVQACYGPGCSGDTDAIAPSGLAYNNARGTPVTVTVTLTVPMSAGALLGLSDFTVTGTSTMLVNH